MSWYNQVKQCWYNLHYASGWILIACMLVYYFLNTLPVKMLNEWTKYPCASHAQHTILLLLMLEISSTTCRFQANMTAYQSLITKSMYDKQLDSGKGTLLHLCDDVVQQEVSVILDLNFINQTPFGCLGLRCGWEINWVQIGTKKNKKSKVTCMHFWLSACCCDKFSL